MISINGYKIKKEIHNGGKSIICSAIREKDNLPVVIKILKSEYPTEMELENFKNEFDIESELKSDNIITNYDFIDYKNTKAIVMEDFGGISLDNFMKNKKLGVKTFLNMAVQLTGIIEEIHKKNIIHKDIKPDNILINPETNEMKLIDFSISTKVNKEIQKDVMEDRIVGSLHYISPEQTGRMNRSIDYRTDFYSLGVTLYKLITGELPFNEDDPAELIYSHIAKNPVPPAALNPEIPEIVSDIIVKLMSKNAEDRYQSAHGLKHDLKKVLDDINESGYPDSFVLGEKDNPDILKIPERLYGRSGELEDLLSAFACASDGNKEIRFFCGGPGIGKSSLINEIHIPILKQHAYFISGKFDVLKRTIPYSAISRAFQDLVRQTITRPEKIFNLIKEEILEVILDNGKVLTDVIPELELLIGRQPDIQPLPSGEAQNRFNMVFRSFVKVFTKREHPLALFIDDLQWADNASLKLIEEVLADNELKYFLFIGAYRDTEVDHAHPLTGMIGRIEANGIKYSTVKIGPLNIGNICELLSDVLCAGKDEIADLASIVHEKSAGNPFFIQEFIMTLYKDGFIGFDNGWKWDLRKIRDAGITDNVVDLMKEKINKLSGKSVDMLKTASCIGINFSPDILGRLIGKSRNDTLAHLIETINEGLILKEGDDFRFVHDRVYEASNALLTEDERRKLHYKIGKMYIERRDGSDQDDLIFNIANNFNLSKDLLTGEEKGLLVDLDLKAGSKAKESAAYNSALHYYKEAVSLLPPDSWKIQPEFTRTILMETAELEYINTNYEESERLYDDILKRTDDLLIKAKIYQNKIISCENQMKIMDAIDLALTILKELGIDLSDKPGANSIKYQMDRFYRNLGNRSIDDLNGLGDIDAEKPGASAGYKEDARKKSEALGIMSSVGVPVWMYMPELFPVMMLEIVNISLEYGLNHFSAVGFVFLGVISCSIMGQTDFGYQLGEFALKILDRFGAKYLRSMLIFLFGCMVHYWKKPARDGIVYLEEAYAEGIENGNLQYASYGISHICMRNIFIGENLNKISELYNKYEAPLQRLKQSDAEGFFNPPRQFVANLLGKARDNEKLIGEYWDEAKMYPLFTEMKFYAGLSLNNIFKMMLLFILSRYDDAYRTAKANESYVAANFGQMQSSIYHFFYALSISAVYDGSSDEVKKELLEKLNSIKIQIELWSKNCPDNYLNKYLIVQAEMLRIEKNDFSAMKFYDDAVRASKKFGFLHEEAIANELAGRYYLSREMDKIASMYLIEARYCYARWGAVVKVRRLEEEFETIYEQLILKGNDGSGENADTMTGFGLDSSSLDMKAIIRSLQSISSEIMMDSLMEKIMKIIFENAGAQRGYLVLLKDDGYYVEYGGEYDKVISKVVKSVPVDQGGILSSSIVRYCAKINEYLVLDNASEEGVFVNDPYIMKNKPKSILCLPVINQTRFIGLIYLENNSATKAFTKNHIDVLKILTSQAAISLENSRMLDILIEKNRLEQEMKIAERIQTGLIVSPPENDFFELAALMKPAIEVGGDYYDIITDKFGNLWFTVGDVSGHGLTAGLIMMMAQTALNTIINESGNVSPKEILVSLNRMLFNNVRQRLKETHFMTMILLKYSGNGKILCSGSHLDVVMYRIKTGKCERIRSEGLFLSIVPDISEKISNIEFGIETGDIMVLYTDGIIESGKSGDKRDMYGMENLCRIIEKNASKDAGSIKDAIFEDVLRWSGKIVDDDMTVIVARRKK
jgi:predicted ATPase/serine phosphatase RsbU (regulator of sigma subunit)